MKNFFKKLFGTLFFQMLSLFVLFGVAFAAFSLPSSTPSGEVVGGKIMNILGDCGTGKYLAGFDKTDFKQICKTTADSVPQNAVMAFNLTSCPDGWKPANGSGKIGGNNIPDLRGEFIRGLDNGRGVDIGRGLGTWQQNMLESHGHNVGSLYSNVGYGTSLHILRAYYASDVTIEGSEIQKTGGTETRPRNIALLYCVKE